MNLVTKKHTITELEEYISNNKLDMFVWAEIAIFQTLTEDFIEKYKDTVFWRSISEYQKLSEPFIERMVDVVDWEYIIRFQKLSYDFLEKHLYRYSLYIHHVSTCVNSVHIIKLRRKYPHKYQIDKLEYELSR